MRITKELYYTSIISLIITLNIFFGIFVWNINDLSPNQALGTISLLFITWTVYIWRQDAKFANVLEGEE